MTRYNDKRHFTASFFDAFAILRLEFTLKNQTIILEMYLIAIREIIIANSSAILLTFKKNFIEIREYFCDSQIQTAWISKNGM